MTTRAITLTASLEIKNAESTGDPVEVNVQFHPQTANVPPHVTHPPSIGVHVAQAVKWIVSGLPEGHHMEFIFPAFPNRAKGPFSSVTPAFATPAANIVTCENYNPVLDDVLQCHVKYNIRVFDGENSHRIFGEDPLIATLGDPPKSVEES